MKYTIFYEQVNRTNFQVKAETEEQAIKKADKLYRKHFELPSHEVQEDWLCEEDGADH